MICGAPTDALDTDFASADGTTITIVPNISDKTINFFIIPPLLVCHDFLIEVRTG
jgi:hypothetical protein